MSSMKYLFITLLLFSLSATAFTERKDGSVVLSAAEFAKLKSAINDLRDNMAFTIMLKNREIETLKGELNRKVCA